MRKRASHLDRVTDSTDRHFSAIILSIYNSFTWRFKFHFSLMRFSLSLAEHSPPTVPLTILELRHHQTKGREAAAPPRGDLEDYLHSYSTSRSPRDNRMSSWTPRHLATLSLLTTELVALAVARLSTICNLLLWRPRTDHLEAVTMTTADRLPADLC